jgi:hypothetical protein
MYQTIHDCRILYGIPAIPTVGSKNMYSSRLGKYQERKLAKRLLLSLIGSIALIVLVLVFGVKILINFSLLVEKLKGTNKEAQQSASVYVAPPILDPLPEATNSATFPITGKGKSGLTLVLQQNNKEVRKLTISKDGTFLVKDIIFGDGQNDFKAQTVDDKGNKSEVSNIISIVFSHKQPHLDVDQPTDNTSINGDNNMLTVTGKTDDGATVTVNGRVAVLDGSNSFSYSLQLPEGNSTITVISTDVAGNQTKVERKVNYQK